MRRDIPENSLPILEISKVLLLYVLVLSESDSVVEKYNYLVHLTYPY
jgi:hypothetical protein